MTAGRRFRTSPPWPDSNETHHTSPRVIFHVAQESLRPLLGVPLSVLVARHLLIDRIKIGVDHMRAQDLFYEPSDLSGPYLSVQTIVDGFVNRDGELSLHK